MSKWGVYISNSIYGHNSGHVHIYISNNIHVYIDVSISISISPHTIIIEDHLPLENNPIPFLFLLNTLS